MRWGAEKAAPPGPKPEGHNATATILAHAGRERHAEAQRLRAEIERDLRMLRQDVDCRMGEILSALLRLEELEGSAEG